MDCGDSRIERRQPLYRRLGSKGFGFFMHACVGLDDVIDTQCGFKFFQAAVAKELFHRQQIDGYMFDVEILFLARQLGHRITQVPVRWRDDETAGCNCCRVTCATFVISCQSAGGTKAKRPRRQFLHGTATDGW